jgi:hypothetical protein
MKKRAKTITLVAVFFSLGLASSHASISLVLSIGVVSGWTSGAVWLVSAGSDGVFSSPFVNGGTSLAGSGDTYIAGAVINTTNYNGGGTTGSIAVPFTVIYGTGIADGNKIKAFWISAPSSAVSMLDLNTGTLTAGNIFTTTGGTLLNWNGYTSTDTETAGGGLNPTMGWALPADSGASALNLSVFTSDDQSGVHADFPRTPGSLDATNVIGVVPEPSTGALMLIGAAGLVALRRLRKV